jgi:UDP-N-acetylglucosamine 4-epimerase
VIIKNITNNNIKKDNMYDTPYHTADLTTQTVLVTGAAGFIGSHISQYLLKYGAKVVAFDSLITGLQSNIDLFKDQPNYRFVKGDLTNLEDCKNAMEGVDVICHQAALGSVPRSLKFPKATHESNVTGFLNILEAAKFHKIKRVVYASSSSVYGDSQELPKVESKIGQPLSPYAVSKYSDELYANVYNASYDMELIGLRYFNVFGPRQNPEGEYAAVIPLFMKSLLSNESPFINGDGEQTRDFTFVENAVQANIRGLFTTNAKAFGEAYNVAFGSRVSLNHLVDQLKVLTNSTATAIHREPRDGDIKDSLANISKAKELMGYNPLFDIDNGLKITLDWFKANKEVLGLH